MMMEIDGGLGKPRVFLVAPSVLRRGKGRVPGVTWKRRYLRIIPRTSLRNALADSQRLAAACNGAVS